MSTRTPKKPFNELARQQKIWYKKLEDSGFEDAEQDENSLKEWSSAFYRPRNTRLQASREPYFRLASHFLHDYQFETERDRVIWEYHAEGLQVHEIVDTLKKVKMPLSRTRVYHTIQRLANSMKAMYLSGHKAKTDE